MCVCGLGGLRFTTALALESLGAEGLKVSAIPV